MNDLSRKLAELGLRLMSEGLPDFIARATTGKWSPLNILEELARLETREKARKSLEGRLNRSRIGRYKPMADFEWSWPKIIDRDLIESAFSLDFIKEGRNFILLSANGLGKTMIMKNIAHSAVLAGYSVLFCTAAQMLDDLNCDSPDLRRRRFFKYTRPALLCIDEVGYLSYDDHAADLLYHVVNPRYENRRSIVVSTNLGFTEWNTVFPNATCITTLLDRLTHHSDFTIIEGDSYRVKESELEAAKRKATRKKKKSTRVPAKRS
ncbi:MAG: ATP-binding protein [Gammaproteobacteria bacterium]|nr:ATP-binding protein [Gammaproteobacteria bacterium]